MAEILTLIVAAFLGSIPTGYLIGRLHGVDIRNAGSGNIGATNVKRVLGKKAGILTLLLDMLKGVAAVYVPALFGVESLHGGVLVPAAGLLAVFGHCFSPFLHFQGGKGVATGVGVFFVLCPAQTITAVAVFAVTVAISRYVSLGSITAVVALAGMLLVHHPAQAKSGTTLAAIIAGALIIWRHRANLQRLISGSENRL